jgi:hypothetical protein
MVTKEQALQEIEHELPADMDKIMKRTIKSIGQSTKSKEEVKQNGRKY